MEKMMTVKTGITNDGVVIAGLISVMFHIRPQEDRKIDNTRFCSCNIVILKYNLITTFRGAFQVFLLVTNIDIREQQEQRLRMLLQQPETPSDIFLPSKTPVSYLVTPWMFLQMGQLLFLFLLVTGDGRQQSSLPPCLQSKCYLGPAINSFDSHLGLETVRLRGN